MTCSFCGRRCDEAGEVVAGEHARICAECVALAVRILDRDRRPAPPA